MEMRSAGAKRRPVPPPLDETQSRGPTLRLFGTDNTLPYLIFYDWRTRLILQPLATRRSVQPSRPRIGDTIRSWIAYHATNPEALTMSVHPSRQAYVEEAGQQVSPNYIPASRRVIDVHTYCQSERMRWRKMERTGRHR